MGPAESEKKAIEGWLNKLRYNLDIHICGRAKQLQQLQTRATLLHMKEAHMKNGQLKPGYNVNVATVSEYIVGFISLRTERNKGLPFLKKLCNAYPVQGWL